MVRAPKVFILKESQVINHSGRSFLSATEVMAGRERKEQRLSLPLHSEKDAIYCLSSIRDEKLLNCHEYSC